MSFLSLLGLPPLAGFVGKLELFTAAIDAEQRESPHPLTAAVAVSAVATVAFGVAAEPLLRLAERASMLS